MSKDFPAKPPSTPVILQELEADGTAHIAWVNDNGWVFIKDSCGDQLKYLPRDIREASEVASFCGQCAGFMIHE